MPTTLIAYVEIVFYFVTSSSSLNERSLYWYTQLPFFYRRMHFFFVKNCAVAVLPFFIFFSRIEIAFFLVLSNHFTYLTTQCAYFLLASTARVGRVFLFSFFFFSEKKT